MGKSLVSCFFWDTVYIVQLQQNYCSLQLVQNDEVIGAQLRVLLYTLILYSFIAVLCYNVECYIVMNCCTCPSLHDWYIAHSMHLHTVVVVSLWCHLYSADQTCLCFNCRFSAELKVTLLPWFLPFVTEENLWGMFYIMGWMPFLSVMSEHLRKCKPLRPDKEKPTGLVFSSTTRVNCTEVWLCC